MRVPREVDRSGKKEPVDSVSRSEEEGEEMVGEMGGGWSSWSGSNIVEVCVCISVCILFKGKGGEIDGEECLGLWGCGAVGLGVSMLNL